MSGRDVGAEIKALSAADKAEFDRQIAPVVAEFDRRVVPEYERQVAAILDSLKDAK